ncbi:MAG: alpha/beta fold hydrolase [Mycobacteriales bacterium]
MEQYTRGPLTFDVEDSGPEHGPVVVLLHGFPQTPASWKAVTPHLTAAGYRVLAPAQRGYSPGARPRGRWAYRISELESDVLALATRAGADRFHVVGHDWGGTVAWSLADRHPERLRTMTSVSTPHARALARAILTSRQVRDSWYMAAFQVPWAPERRLLAGDGGLLRRQLVRTGLPDEYAAEYAAALGTPEALTGAINWYRAIPFNTAAMAGARPVTVPTLYVWGDRDRFLGRGAAERSGRWVRAPYAFREFAGVPHWVPETAPDALADAILEHLSSYR